MSAHGAELRGGIARPVLAIDAEGKHHTHPHGSVGSEKGVQDAYTARLK